MSQQERQKWDEEYRKKSELLFYEEFMNENHVLYRMKKQVMVVRKK